MRLSLIAALLCGVLGSVAGVRAQHAVAYGQIGEEQIKAEDGRLKQMAEEPQSPAGTSFRTVPSTHRVASSRPVRLLPTHGGRTGQNQGRWAADGFSLHKYLPGWQCFGIAGQHRAAPSPRLYYVIALRRLLC